MLGKFSSLTCKTAISVSGLSDQYFFYGFLPKKPTAIEKELKKLKEHKFNLVFFIPAKKINFYIKNYLDNFY